MAAFAKSWRREWRWKQPASCLLEREDCTLVAWYRSLDAPRHGRERMTVTIGRRELLVALGGAVVLWAIAATGPGAAQQPSKIPRVGILTSRGRVLEKISKEIK